ncbi:hypothetical protein OG225_27240 [Nocardia sp. NBC_01377]|uniref:hypothetical protein n=1 Tax=Nocardia sp. NBC_01377 TaxID=2903595 RepID=UPI0032520D66
MVTYDAGVSPRVLIAGTIGEPFHPVRLEVSKYTGSVDSLDSSGVRWNSWDVLILGPDATLMEDLADVGERLRVIQLGQHPLA